VGRFINRDALLDSPRDAEGRRLCRWSACGKRVAPPRRSWCSKECVDAYLIRSSASVAAWHVFKRDKGVCALCGIDTQRIMAGKEAVDGLLRGWYRSTARTDEILASWPELAAALNWQVENSFGPLVKYYAPRFMQHLWEADHIVPAAEGGGGMAGGLENLRTLCRICHNDETRKLRQRLSQRRRAQRPLPLEAGA
jgi:5-methylcytosine-specific restriction endonuclease McrA